MKRTALLLLAFALTFSLSSCGNQSSNESKKEDAPAQTDFSTDSPSLTSDNIATPEPTSKPTPTPTPVPPPTPAPILVSGETQTIDNTCEFYLDFTDITAKVVPPSQGGSYRYYSADTGKIYVDVCVAYKNLSTREVGADEVIGGKLTYAGKYNYSGFSVIEEDSRSDFTYSNITNIDPLTTEYLHMLFEVPEEVDTSGASIKVTLTIAGKSFDVIVREGSSEQDTTVTQNGKSSGKTSGEVMQGEVLAGSRAEVYIDYCDITSKVVPPQAGGAHSYYAADSGKTYVDVCFAYRNLGEDSIDAEEAIAASLKYAEKYDYSGFSIIEEDSRSDFTYSNITNIKPLTTEYIHYLFEVPEEIQNSTEAIKITFSFGGNTFAYKFR